MKKILSLQSTIEPLNNFDKEALVKFPAVYSTIKQYAVKTSDGVPIRIREARPINRNSIEESLLLVPGIFMNSFGMDFLARSLVEKGYTTFLMDFRGLREIRTVKSWSFEDYIHRDFPAALDFCKEKTEKKLTVIGHSMGGMITKFYAGAYPEKSKEQINKIVTIGSPSLAQTDLSIFSNIKTLTCYYPKWMMDITLYLLAEGLPDSLKIVERNAVETIVDTVLDKVCSTRKLKVIDEIVGLGNLSEKRFKRVLKTIIGSEHIRVLVPFIRSEFTKSDFYSIDRLINYTEKERQIEIPIFYAIGEKDKISPFSTVVKNIRDIKSEEKYVAFYNTGHMGLIWESQIVKNMTTDIDCWIRNSKMPLGDRQSKL